MISIIALLIALLLPALSKARDAARAVQCLSNQKQLGLMVATYTNDHDGWLVTSDGEMTWPSRLIIHNYGGQWDAATIYWKHQEPGSGNPVTGADPEVEHFSIFYCPYMSSIGFTGDPSSSIRGWTNRGYYTNFAINFQLFGSWGPLALYLPRQIHEMRKPSKCGQLWDTRGIRHVPVRHVGSNVLYQITSHNPNSSVGYVHGYRELTPDLLFLGGASNTLFLDGHSEPVPDPGIGMPHPIAYDGPNKLWE